MCWGALPTLPFNKYLVRQIKHVMGQLKNIKVCDKILDSFIEAHLIEMFSIMGKITAISLEEYKQTNQFESEDKEARFQEFLKNTFFSKDSLWNYLIISSCSKIGNSKNYVSDKELYYITAKH